MIDPIGTLRWIRARVDLIFALVNATLTLQETGGTITTTGAEQDVYRVEAPLGVFEPKIVQIDMTNNTAAETVRVRIYYRIAGGGNGILENVIDYAGVQAVPLKTFKLEPNREGIRLTLHRLAGGAQDYDWSAKFRS